MSDYRAECLERALKAIYRAAFEGDVFPSTVAGLVEAHAGQFGFGVDLEDQRECKTCRGYGTVEMCCGHGISGDYFNPPECCGQMVRDDCVECNCTGRAPTTEPEETAHDLPF